MEMRKSSYDEVIGQVRMELKRAHWRSGRIWKHLPKVLGDEYQDEEAGEAAYIFDTEISRYHGN